MTIEELQADLDKATTEKANLNKALSEERTRRKSAEAQVSSQETTSTEHITAVEKERDSLKAKVETLTSQIGEKDSLLEESKTKATELESKATKFDEFVTKSLEDKLGKIPEDKKEFVQKALNGRTLDEQSELLDWFADQYKDFKSSPADWKGGESPADTSEYQKAKEEKNVMGMIKNAPSISQE